ncbi:DNA-binding response regulator [marine bacterium AO1-C]|nr:DNA-binding response regulator [marine bacterium AO1-C]
MTQKLKCVIVDDEPIALDILTTYIERVDQLELVARCKNAFEAFNFLQSNTADLLFMDIKMPQMTGIDFVKNFKNHPKVIFTTAYEEYALESYELDVVDYLLKPISFQRFFKALSKIFKNMPASIQSTTVVLPEATPKQPFIILKVDKKNVKVYLSEILYIESLDHNARVKTVGKELFTYQKISYLEEILPADQFIRIHRSFMVALDKIEAFSSTIVEVGGKELPIGRNYKALVMKVLKEQAENL